MGCGSSKTVPTPAPQQTVHVTPPTQVSAPPVRAVQKQFVEDEPVSPSVYKPGQNSKKARKSDPAYIHRSKVLSKLNTKIDKEINRQNNQNIQRALFLGTGESGKSTIFKQMRLCYGNSYTDFERSQYAKIIWLDTIRALRLLIDICLTECTSKDGNPELKELVSNWFGEKSTVHLRKASSLMQSLDLTRKQFVKNETDPLAKAFLHNHIDTTEPTGDSLLRHKIAVAEVQGRLYNFDPLLTAAINGSDISGELKEFNLGPKFQAERDYSLLEIKDAVIKIWGRCPPLVKRLMAANQLGLETNSVYFLERFAPKYADGCMASDDDIVHSRVKTTGITTATFNIRGRQLIVSDVGGQRIERRKWIHSFDDVTCILFVASVSEYDQVLDEDSRVNRLEEALQVFYKAVNSRWFRAKSVQLFLNKTDILTEKCKYSSFKKHFPKFKGNEQNPNEIMNFIEREFENRFRSDGRGLYVHRVSATDTTAMKFVIDASSDMILMENMKWAGMI